MGTKRRRSGRGLSGFGESFAHVITAFTGSSLAFIIALTTVLIWAALGPVFGFSDTWQLVINTGTTIITFLMVFLIQRGQNKDTQAVHLKLNELVAALKGASNRLIDVEDLTEDELNVLYKHYKKLAELSKSEADIRKAHSIEEAEHRHRRKFPKNGA